MFINYIFIRKSSYPNTDIFQNPMNFNYIYVYYDLEKHKQYEWWIDQTEYATSKPDFIDKYVNELIQQQIKLQEREQKNER